MHSRLPSTLALSLMGATFLSALAVAQPAPPATSPSNATAPTPAPTTKTPEVSPAEAKAAADRNAENKAMASFKAFFDAKLAGLHAGLELTPAQASLWPPVETAIRDLEKTMFAIHHPAEANSADAHEQLARTADRLIRSGQAMKTLADATGPFIATLDPDQKERLAKLLQGLSPPGILREAFNVADGRADDDRFDDRPEHGRMERPHHHENHSYDRHRDDEAYGDRPQEDDADRGMREDRFDHGHGYDHERGADDRDFMRRHEEDESSDHRGPKRHRGDMDDERT